MLGAYTLLPRVGSLRQRVGRGPPTEAAEGVSQVSPDGASSGGGRARQALSK